MSPTDAFDNLESTARLLTSVIIYGSGLCLGLVAGKCLLWNRPQPTFKILNLDVNLDYAWIVVAALTIAHLFVGILFLRAVATIVACGHADWAGMAWNKLINTADKLTLFIDLQPRPTYLLFNLVPVSLPDTQNVLHDPIMWLHVAVSIVIVPAIVRLRHASVALRTLTLVVAPVLLVSNWYIGSEWALSASDLQRVSVNSPLTMLTTHQFVLGAQYAHCEIK